MGIFGTTAPKFIFSGTTVNLTYGIITKSEPVTEYIEQKSEITGNRDLISRGTHWTVEIRYHLYKHTTAPTPAAFYTTLTSYKGKQVSLYLHADGAQFYTAAATDAHFVLKEITPFYLTTTDYKDALILLFESVDTILQS